MSSYCLEVRCLENLQWKSRFHSEVPDLYVEVKLGADIKTTRTIRKSRAPVWDERLIFYPLDAFDTFSISVLHDSDWLPDPCVGSVDITIADLSAACANGEAHLDLSPPSNRRTSGRSGTLVMYLERVDSQAIATIMIDKATDEVQQSGIAHSPQTPETLDSVNDRMTQLSKGTDLYQAVCELVSRLDPLMKVIDVISSIHPYLTIAWNLSSGILKAVKHVINADKKVVELVSTMKDAYAFTCDALSLPDKVATLNQSIDGLVKQTIECCLFVEKYARRGFTGKMLDRSLSNKIDEFEQSLTAFKKEIESGVALHTAFVSVRISYGIDELLLRQRLRPSRSDASNRSVCLTGTRTDILNDISDWIFSETDQNIFWLHGVAGSGKSTVSMSIAERLRGLSHLGGLVMFERGRGDPLSVIRTIAYKLALYDSRIASRIIAEMNGDKDIVTATLETQFDKLLLRPLNAVAGSLLGPVAFVFDALDECGTQDSRRSLLRLFRYAFAKLPKNFRFLITSRREPDIDTALSSQPEAICVEELDYNSTASQQDVLSYLHTKIPKIVRKYANLEAAKDWNGDESIARLGKAAGGLFIFASTAIKMISNSNYPFEDLQDLISNTSSVSSSGLDQLYSTALETSGIVWTDDRSRSRFAMVLGLVVLNKTPLSSQAIDDMIGFLPHQGSLQILKHLRCLLTYSPGGPVSLLHTSFSDYLMSPARVNDPWYIDVSEQQHFIATRSFAIMRGILHFNMGGLETSFVRNKDVPRLAVRVKRLIPGHLKYACLYWSSHLCSSPFSSELMGELSGFVHERLLFWFEVLSLVGMFHRFASRALFDAAAWTESYSADLSSFLKEASRLATEFAVPITQSSPHIYTSMIPLTKSDSEVSLHYSKRMSRLVLAKWYGYRQLSAWLKVLEGHSGYVLSVSFSPDGTSIVSASRDGTARVWDIASGEEIHRLAHGSVAWSVSFSPDGSRLVTGCADHFVRIWDAREGNLILTPLKRHTDIVASVGFSLDGKRIASGSYDRTVIIWDALSGAVIAGPFSGHSDAVWSVSFSPDGTRVASGSADRTLRIWDVETGKLVLEPLIHPAGVRSVAFCPTADRIASCLFEEVWIWDLESGVRVSVFPGGRCAGYSPCGTRIATGSTDGSIFVRDANSGEVNSGPLEGHSQAVVSVEFSRDGKHIVSGSSDRTIRIWNSAPRQVDQGQVIGHTSAVISVAFSPCGRWIASASLDRTIIIWNARTGRAVMRRLRGHMHEINSVVFSPDGSRLVSGSSDRTIRIWDVESGKLVARPLKGHTGGVRSVALSPDGMQIASGSFDATIRIWDMAEYKIVAGPLRHHSGAVRSVAFSPDGRWLASGSDDKTIRIWDTTTWEPMHEPLIGHKEVVRSVCFSPDSIWIASGSGDRSIIVWDVATRQIIAGPFRGHGDGVRPVVFLPDGLHLASGAADNTIRLWNIETGQAVGDPLHGHSGIVMSLSLSSDGTRVASGSWDKTLKVWDVSAILRLAQKRSLTAIPGPSSEQDMSDWIMAKDGWILGGPKRRDLLLWIPPDLRRTLLLPQNTAICCDFSTKVDFAVAALGRLWTKCFLPDRRGN